MFNVGGGEFLVIALVALIVLGPDKLPEVARKVGNVMSEVRAMSNGFRREMRDAMEDPIDVALRDRDGTPRPSPGSPGQAAKPSANADKNGHTGHSNDSDAGSSAGNSNSNNSNNDAGGGTTAEADRNRPAGDPDEQ